MRLRTRVTKRTNYNRLYSKSFGSRNFYKIGLRTPDINGKETTKVVNHPTQGSKKFERVPNIFAEVSFWVSSNYWERFGPSLNPTDSDRRL